MWAKHSLGDIQYIITNKIEKGNDCSYNVQLWHRNPELTQEPQDNTTHYEDQEEYGTQKEYTCHDGFQQQYQDQASTAQEVQEEIALPKKIKTKMVLKTKIPHTRIKKRMKQIHLNKSTRN